MKDLEIIDIGSRFGIHPSNKNLKVSSAQNNENAQIQTMYEFLTAIQEDIENFVEENTSIKVASSPMRRAKTAPPPSFHDF